MYALSFSGHSSSPAAERRRTELDDACLARARDTRSVSEEFLKLALVLPDSDRILLESIDRDGRSGVEVSRLMGVPVRLLRARIRRLRLRLAGPLFQFVAANRAKWTSTRQRVATACFLHGRSLNGAAIELGLTRHVVRRHCAVVRELFAEHNKAEVRS